MKLVFCLQINIEVFYKFIHSFWVYIARHAQSTQNYKFAISLQYLKEKVKMKLIFILQINIKVFFQIDDIILGVCVASHAQITQNCNFAFFCNIFRKKWLMKLIFCIQISIKTSYKLILWFLMGMIKHFQSSQVSKIASSQNSKFAISSQYISKKVVWKLIFCMQINIKISYKLIFNTLDIKFPLCGHGQTFSKYSK